ncbi:MAG: amidohydrolase family protein, partial [Actinomycetes bacterium]
GAPKIVTELKQQAGLRAEMADLRSAGTGATVPGGHPCQLVAIGAYPPFPTLTGPEEAEQFVAARRAEGSDYLKVLIEPGGVLGAKLPTLDADTVAALVAAAHRRRMLVLAHATEHVSAQLALDAGVDGLAHIFIDQLPSSRFVDTAVARGMFVVPTLVVLENICGQSAADELLNDPRIAPYLDAMSRTLLTMNTWPTPLGAPPDFSVALTMVAQLNQAGVSILAGTDAGASGTVHGASIHHELELLVRAGLPPSQALTAATAAPAARFGLTDRGRIAPGLAADLLLVDGDPTVDITTTRNIVGVWRRGVRFDRSAHRAAVAQQPLNC